MNGDYVYLVESEKNSALVWLPPGKAIIYQQQQLANFREVKWDISMRPLYSPVCASSDHISVSIL